MIVNTSAVIAAIDRAAPATSSRGALRSRSGTIRQAAAATAMEIGTLMKNTDPHQKFSTASHR